MEPVDYVKILRRHWKMVVGLVLIALVVVFITTPKAPDTVYEAKHRLLREQASGSSEGTASADNVNVVRMWATAGEVPERVAEKIGYDGPPDELASTLKVTPNPELGTVEITASAPRPEQAIVVANAFAEELLAFLDERDAERVKASTEESAVRAAELRKRMEDLDNQIAAGGDAVPALRAERDGVSQQLALAFSDSTAERTPTEWASMQVASTATEQEQFVAGVSREQRLLLAMLVALLLGFGVAIMLDRSDSRLHSKEQTERQFGLPVLAEVPVLPMRTRHRAAVWGYENDPRVAEAYRSLRTALLLFRDNLSLELETAELPGSRGRQSTVGRKVVLVTSPEAGDGKSTSAANLAIAYAEAGQAVLLISWDLWRPLPARVFEAEDKPGVSEYLHDPEARLMDYVQSTAIPGLHLVAAGESGKSSGIQLDAELQLLEEARSLADVVIIDTAPILSASVTRELVTMADVVIVACRAGRTTSPAAGRCAELLERLGAPTLGVVLVGVPTGPFTDYYGGGSGASGVGASVRRVFEDRSTPQAREPVRESATRAGTTGATGFHGPNGSPPPQPQGWVSPGAPSAGGERRYQ